MSEGEDQEGEGILGGSRRGGVEGEIGRANPSRSFEETRKVDNQIFEEYTLQRQGNLFAY